MPGRELSDNAVRFPTNKEIADAGSRILAERLQKLAEKLKISDTTALIRSVNARPIATGDILKIQLTYNLYGKYVDMGVGRGVSVGGRGSASFARNRRSDGKLLRYRRKPRKWYSPVIGKEVVVLSAILADNYQKRFGQSLVSIPRVIEL